MSDNNTGIWFQSAVSGLWYEEPLAVGTISAVKVDGVAYSRPDGKAPTISEAIEKVREIGSDWRADGALEKAYAVDYLVTALESLQSTPVGKPRCVKCGHDYVDREGVCRTQVSPPNYRNVTYCGCKCEFSSTEAVKLIGIKATLLTALQSASILQYGPKRRVEIQSETSREAEQIYTLLYDLKTSIATAGGDKCEFSVGKEAGEQRAREWLPPLPLPWIDANDHAWELRRGIDCVECPDCCFVFAAIHCNGDDGGYTCPNCHGNSRATPSPVDHERQAREIVERLAREIRKKGFKGELYEAVESLMDERGDNEDDHALANLIDLASPIITTALQASAGVDPRPSLQSIYKAIEDALNSYRMHHTRELPDLDNGLSLVDRLSPDADSDVTRGREELDLLIDHICGAVGDVFRSTDAVPSEAAQQAARVIHRLCDEMLPDIPGDSTSYAPTVEQIAEIISRRLTRLTT